MFSVQSTFFLFRLIELMDQVLEESCKKFEEALRLIDQSHDDPDTEPFKSRYAASEVFGTIKQDLTSRLEYDRTTQACSTCYLFFVQKRTSYISIPVSESTRK